MRYSNKEDGFDLGNRIMYNKEKSKSGTRIIRVDSSMIVLISN